MQLMAKSTTGLQKIIKTKHKRRSKPHPLNHQKKLGPKER